MKILLLCLIGLILSSPLVAQGSTEIEYQARRNVNGSIVDGKFLLQYEGEVLTIEHLSKNTMGLVNEYAPSTITKYGYQIFIKTNTGKTLFLSSATFKNSPKESFFIGDAFDYLDVSLVYSAPKTRQYKSIKKRLMQTSTTREKTNYLQELHPFVELQIPENMPEDILKLATRRRKKPAPKQVQKVLDFYVKAPLGSDSAKANGKTKAQPIFAEVFDLVSIAVQAVSYQPTTQAVIKYRNLRSSAIKQYYGEFSFTLEGNKLTVKHNTLNTWVPSNMGGKNSTPSPSYYAVDFIISDQQSGKSLYLDTDSIMQHSVSEYRLPFSSNAVFISATEGMADNVEFDYANQRRVLQNSKPQLSKGKSLLQPLARFMKSNIVRAENKTTIISDQSLALMPRLVEGKSQEIHYIIEVDLEKFECFFKVTLNSDSTLKIEHYSKYNMGITPYMRENPAVPFMISRLHKGEGIPLKMQDGVGTISLQKIRGFKQARLHFVPDMEKALDPEHIYYEPINPGFRFSKVRSMGRKFMRSCVSVFRP